MKGTIRRSLGLAACLIFTALLPGGIWSSAGSSVVRAAGAPLAIVVHPNSPQKGISLSVLQRIYSGKPTPFGGGKLFMPLSHPPRSSVRVQFDRSVFQMTPEQIAAFWIDQRIRGKGAPPRAVNSPMLIMGLASKLPGVISYVPANIVVPAVRVLEIDGCTPAQACYPLK